MQLKFVYLLSAVVLMCCSFCEAVQIGFPWNRFRTWDLDRSVSQFASPGYYVQPVDKTGFSVSQPLWLEQFDVSKIYVYDPIKEIISDNVTVKFKIIEIFKEDSHEKIIFKGQTVLNSTYEANVNTKHSDTGIQLKPGYTYEIQLEIPQEKQLMYNEFLEIKEFNKRRFLHNFIYIRFYQVNPDSKPPTEGDTNRKLSHGLVKRLYLKYTMF